MHKGILNPLIKNDFNIFIGKSNHGFPTFKGTIMDMRFYYENALEFSLIAKIMGEKFTSYYP